MTRAKLDHGGAQPCRTNESSLHNHFPFLISLHLSNVAEPRESLR